jgi:hypothetical protein
MKIGTKILLFTGIAGVLTAIGLTIKREATLLWDYEWSFKNYIIRQISKNRAVIDFYFNVENKSKLEVSIESYDIDLYAEGIYISKLTGGGIQIIKAEGFSTFALRADFVPQDVLKGGNLTKFLTAFAGLGDIQLKFTGSFNASHSFLKVKKFPFNYETNLKRFL